MLAQGRSLSRVERGWREALSLLLLWNLAASSPVEEEKNTQKGQPGIDGVVEGVRKDFPGAFQTGQNATVIAGRLLRAVKDRPGSAEEALARRLAAEAYQAAGREAEARALLELVRR